MIEDEILREIRATREAFARSFDYDLEAMAAHLQRQNEEGDWPVVRLAPRHPAGSVEAPAATDPESGVIEAEAAPSERS